ncbi:hypothetical protein HMPREF1986_00536 [Oribacterium sp. oral taxon 078 str. F0263]|nr:hypothetical protein HMPREF1986_00536 [Oribacterium sp. oral taxon 078 str. F0263]
MVGSLLSAFSRKRETASGTAPIPPPDNGYAASCLGTEERQGRGIADHVREDLIFLRNILIL